MPGQQFATILARTDPFDAAQGVERHVRTLGAEQVRETIRAALARMNESYRAEFAPLLDEPDDRINEAFARALKSNLRAIPLFGPAFCEGVISKLPGDRAIGLGEEQHPARPVRPLAFAAVAVALVLLGAGAQHAWSTARANAQTPVVLETPIPVAVAAPRATSSADPAPKATPIPTKPPATAAPATATPAPATPVPATAPPATPGAVAAARPHPQTHRSKKTPPPGRGVKTIVLATPAPSPTTGIDLSDMPRAYSDATPLPGDPTPPPARLSAPVKVHTPTPAPRRGSWLHRTIMHLDPFKPHPHPAPTATAEMGPQPLPL